MKNLLTLTFGICFNFCLTSQITIDFNNLPDIGSEISISIDSFEQKNYGVSDLTNMQTWDFTHLYPNFEDTLSYLSILQTPFSHLDSTDADFALSLGEGFLGNLSATAGLNIDSAHIYFDVNTSGMYGVAMAAKADGKNVVLMATDPEVFFPIPMQLGQNVMDTARYEVVMGDSTLIHYVYKTITVDGFGSLSMSQGTFPVIRFVEHTLNIDSLYAIVNIGGQSLPISLEFKDSSKRISFLTNDTLYKHPLVTLTLETTSDSSDVKHATWVWDGTYPQNSIEEKRINIIKNAYPNPVSSHLNIDVFSDESKLLDILFLDINGRIVNTSSISVSSGSNALSMPVLDFSSGNYFIAIKSAGKLLGCWPFEKL